MNSILWLLLIFQILYKYWASVRGAGREEGWLGRNGAMPQLCITQAKTYLGLSPQVIPSRGTCGLTCPATSPNSALLLLCRHNPFQVILAILLGGYRTVIFCCALHADLLSHGSVRGLFGLKLNQNPLSDEFPINCQIKNSIRFSPGFQTSVQNVHEPQTCMSQFFF